MGPIQQMKALDKQIQEQERVIETLQKEHAKVKVGLFFSWSTLMIYNRENG